MDHVAELGIRVTLPAEISASRQIEGMVARAIREGRVAPGDLLPSTRSVAASVGVHRNTVAAAYRRVEGAGLVEIRRGSRVRVRDALTEAGVGCRVDVPAGHVAVLEPDADVRTLAVAEVSRALSRCAVTGGEPDDSSRPHVRLYRAELRGFERSLRAIPRHEVLLVVSDCGALLEAARVTVAARSGDRVTLVATAPGTDLLRQALPLARAVWVDRRARDRVRAQLDRAPLGRTPPRLRTLNLVGTRTVRQLRARFAGRKPRGELQKRTSMTGWRA